MFLKTWQGFKYRLDVVRAKVFAYTEVQYGKFKTLIS